MLDTNNIYEKLINIPELQDIPTIYIVKVAVALLSLIEKE